MRSFFTRTHTSRNTGNSELRTFLFRRKIQKNYVNLPGAGVGTE